MATWVDISREPVDVTVCISIPPLADLFPLSVVSSGHDKYTNQDVSKNGDGIPT